MPNSNVFTFNFKYCSIYYCGCYNLFHREQQLNALLRMYEENEDAMCEALAKDLHKSRQESIINEIELLRNDVRNLIMNFRSYAAIEYVSICKFSL